MAQHQKTTGLFFGSFNPVHTGHLIIASHFVQHTDIENIWFVLSPQNPFKTNEQLLDNEKRLELLHLAVYDNEAFSVCDMELTMETPSYSINTIRKLQKEYPKHSFVLIIGSDNLDEFDQWKDYRKILELVKVYVYPRGTGSASPLLSHPSVRVVDAPRIDISSTMIRDAICTGKNPIYLLPGEVLQRIMDKGYYFRPKNR